MNRALALAKTVVAADGGADQAVNHGVIPDAVIGDFDSITNTTRARIPEDRLHPDQDQDTTDFDKCLSQISRAFDHRRRVHRRPAGSPTGLLQYAHTLSGAAVYLAE